ncbi:hypothetical protein ANANG_G00066800, partial [Anguilla anguilla]
AAAVAVAVASRGRGRSPAPWTPPSAWSTRRSTSTPCWTTATTPASCRDAQPQRPPEPVPELLPAHHAPQLGDAAAAGAGRDGQHGHRGHELHANGSGGREQVSQLDVLSPGHTKPFPHRPGSLAAELTPPFLPRPFQFRVISHTLGFIAQSSRHAAVSVFSSNRSADMICDSLSSSSCSR